MNLFGPFSAGLTGGIAQGVNQNAISNQQQDRLNVEKQYLQLRQLAELRQQQGLSALQSLPPISGFGSTVPPGQPSTPSQIPPPQSAPSPMGQQAPSGPTQGGKPTQLAGPPQYVTIPPKPSKPPVQDRASMYQEQMTALQGQYETQLSQLQSKKQEQERQIEAWTIQALQSGAPREAVISEADKYRGRVESGYTSATKALETGLTAKASALRESFNIQHQTAMEKKASGGPTISFPTDAIDIAAYKYLQTGNLPPMGMGKSGVEVRGKILNRAAELAKEQGISSQDVAPNQAQFKSDQTSLTALTKQYDAVTAFEKNAIRNGDRLVQLGDKVDTTGVPVIERWIRSGRQAIAGDSEVSKFNAQMQVYRTEAAKILTNPNLTGQLTDTARKEVEQFLGNNMSASQIKGVVDLLKSDFENRKATIETQIQDIKGRMKGKPGSQESLPNAPKVGTVESGYKFKGGDPSDPKNWEKQ